MALSNKQAEYFEYFRPHYGIHSFSEFGKLNGNCRLPDVDVGVIANWFEDEENQLGLVA